MCVWAYFMFVLFCVKVAALRRADPPSKETYLLCLDSESEKRSGPTRAARA
jgi:hypothetical protein